ncbi:hypothetical protein N9863_02135 [Flavobacteriaceae bacterium]|nr:hypothetical protein [Gammaproteobacteria bacterium]MDB4280400.1 hypothetical protein [Flavobacteriaceae bacterium]
MINGMNQNNLLTTPLTPKRSTRIDQKTVITSGNAGKIIPVACIPLLREDGVKRSRMQIAVEMMETAEVLFNGVNVTVNAHLVPKLAFDRFNGMDDLNRSYQGVPREDGETPIPFIETHTFSQADNEFYKTLGMHAQGSATVNRDYIEAYNTVVNFRRKERSSSLTMRTMTDTSLAQAFWNHTTMAHIVPDFDQAIIDGEVALNVAQANLPLHSAGSVSNSINGTIYRTPRGSANFAPVGSEGDQTWGDEIWAELTDNGITVSLSNIELAKKTQAFAKARSMFQGHDDDYIIDTLMSGIRIPDQAMKQPILLAQQRTQMGYQQRFASDAANLDESVAVGGALVDITMRTPAINTGGIIVITAEITPEQIFERQKDHYLYNVNVNKYPEFTRDELDPEKVSVVTNDHIDVDHSNPNAVFGYAPLNHEYMRSAPNIGGKYYRPEVDASFDEDRQKIWANETVDPELTEDFYLCNNIHHKVFSDSISDAFEITARGTFEITGNTVFGGALKEATDDYDEVMADVDQTRLTKA